MPTTLDYQVPDPPADSGRCLRAIDIGLSWCMVFAVLCMLFGGFLGR